MANPNIKELEAAIERKGLQAPYALAILEEVGVQATPDTDGLYKITQEALTSIVDGLARLPRGARGRAAIKALCA